MAPNTANQLRSQLTRIEPSLTRQWGAFLSLKLQSRTAWSEEYEARFQHARVRWKIACQGAGGKITGIAFRTLS